MELIKIDSRLRTTSKNVSDVFGKRHVDVVSKIEKMQMSNEFRQRNFSHTEIIDNNGSMINGYSMTRDGWSFLVMGFTGSKAAMFKEKYIDAFNAMEEKIKEMSVINPKLLPDFNDPVAAARAWADAKESELKAKLELTEAKPKIESFETFIDSSGLSDIGQVAKMIGTGRNRLFKILRTANMLMDNNTPYQRYIEAGYFEVKKSTHNGINFTTTLVTPRGVDKIRKMFSE